MSENSQLYHLHHFQQEHRLLPSLDADVVKYHSVTSVNFDSFLSFDSIKMTSFQTEWKITLSDFFFSNVDMFLN